MIVSSFTDPVISNVPTFQTSTSGIYISLEGIDGCGKTTQAQILVDILDAQLTDRKVMLVREPGTTPASEYIRRMLVTTGRPEMHALTELLLFTAARYEAMHDIILPELESGTIIISDRCTDSTLVFQHTVDRDIILKQAHMACGGICPQMSIILDISVDEAIARTQSSGNWDERHYERVERSVIEDRRRRYMDLTSELSPPWKRAVVNAHGTRDQVTQRILRTISQIDALR